MEMVDSLGAIAQPQRVDLLLDIRRRRAQLDFEETVLLAAMKTDPNPYDDPMSAIVDFDARWLEDEVACALRIAPVTAAQKLERAASLVARFPRALAAMADGELPGFYAARLVDATSDLTPDACAQVELRVLPRAGEQTVSQFSASVRRAALRADTRCAQQKHVRARDDRRVVFGRPDDAGMSTVWAFLPADQAARLKAKVDALACSWERLDDRTGDQRRADALATLGDEPATTKNEDADAAPDGRVDVTATINVTVSLSTLLGLDDQPGDLDGDPVTATVVRAMVQYPGAHWRWLLLDGHGKLCDVVNETYRPSTALARFVQLRDITCQFPRCRRKATRCDLDHRTQWSRGGPTSAANLHCLCPRHHKLKHEAGWAVVRLSDGTTRWTDPGGHVYRQPPPDHLNGSPPETQVEPDYFGELATVTV